MVAFDSSAKSSGCCSAKSFRADTIKRLSKYKGPTLKKQVRKKPKLASIKSNKRLFIPACLFLFMWRPRQFVYSENHYFIAPARPKLGKPSSQCIQMAKALPTI